MLTLLVVPEWAPRPAMYALRGASTLELGGRHQVLTETRPAFLCIETRHHI